jgi:hypothetical protein
MEDYEEVVVPQIVGFMEKYATRTWELDSLIREHMA